MNPSDESATNEVPFISFPPNQPPEILDPVMLQELEAHAEGVAQQVHHLLDHVRSQMFEFTGLAHQTVQVYREGTDSLEKALEEQIMTATNLINHCDKIDKNFASLYSLREQTKTIKSSLDTLERLLR